MHGELGRRCTMLISVVICMCMTLNISVHEDSVRIGTFVTSSIMFTRGRYMTVSKCRSERKARNSDRASAH